MTKKSKTNISAILDWHLWETKEIWIMNIIWKYSVTNVYLHTQFTHSNVKVPRMVDAWICLVLTIPISSFHIHNSYLYCLPQMSVKSCTNTCFRFFCHSNIKINVILTIKWCIFDKFRNICKDNNLWLFKSYHACHAWINIGYYLCKYKEIYQKYTSISFT